MLPRALSVPRVLSTALKLTQVGNLALSLQNTQVKSVGKKITLLWLTRDELHDVTLVVIDGLRIMIARQKGKFICFCFVINM